MNCARLVPALTVAGILAACGSSARTTTRTARTDCAILASGAKLCGADLAAYCQRFADQADRETAAACGAANAASADPAARSACSGYAEGSPERSQCLARGGDYNFTP